MKQHRFIGNFNLHQRTLTLDDQKLVHQMHEVLKLQVGEELILCDGKLREARARITALNKRRGEVTVLGVNELKNEPGAKTTLYCAILKNNNFDLVAEKATEVGVQKIVPIITERTVKLNLKTERIRKIMKEAAEQCGRGMVPQCEEPMKFPDALNHAAHNNINIIFDPTANDQLPTSNFQLPEIGIFIGPEGGWTKEEMRRARKQNCKILSLGFLTFRAETAAIIAAYLINHAHHE